MTGGSTWEPEQETSFGGKTKPTRLKEEWVEGLYRKLSDKTGQNPEAFLFNDFELRDGNCTMKARASP